MSGLEVTEVNIYPLKHKQEGNPVEAFASITFNESFVIKGIKVINGKFGRFISWPREYNKTEGKGYNLCFPITKSLQEHISRKVLGVFDGVENG